MGQITVEKNVGGIEGLCVITPAVHGDNRGYFMETYNQNDMEEGFENTVAVDIGRFFQLIRDAAVELPHDENKQSVLKGKPRQRKQNKRHIRIVDSLREAQRRIQSCRLEQAKEVKINKFLYKGGLQYLVRYDHRQHDKRKHDAAALEFEFCKSIADKRTNKGLDHRAAER